MFFDLLTTPVAPIDFHPHTHSPPMITVRQESNSAGPDRRVQVNFGFQVRVGVPDKDLEENKGKIYKG